MSVNRRNQQRKAIILRAMPLYQFELHNGRRLDDQEATEFLPDDKAACEEALQIIHDLKKNNVSGWKGWTIEVTEGDRQVWQIPFIGAQ
jgi:hypothetical protein